MTELLKKITLALIYIAILIIVILVIVQNLNDCMTSIQTSLDSLLTF